jgi:hypothetical protein
LINLFLRHHSKQCGVRSHGDRFVRAMLDHAPVGDKWIVEGVASMDAIREAVWYWKPDITIMNFHPATIPKLEPEKNFNLKTKFVALPHENLTPEGARNFLKINTQFSAALWQDPTLGTMCEYEQFGIYVIPRLIPRLMYVRKKQRRGIPKDHTLIKVFGFGFGDKQPEMMIKFIEESFDKATIECHFPKNEIADPDGRNGEIMVERLRAAVTKPGIQIIISLAMFHESYMAENDLVSWLADADINLCLHGVGSGIASTTDMMMAARTPFAINDSPFFRHLPGDIKLGPENTMKDVLNKGIGSWEKLVDEVWSPKVFAEGVRNALTLIKNRVR